MSSVAELAATELRRRIGNRTLSPVELVEDCIGRIEVLNGSVNAVVTENFAQALIEAKHAERAVSSGRGLPKLHGLPVLVKDLSDTKGIRTTYGSCCFADHIPQSDSILVALLREAGAIILGKTNTPEFGAGANTSNLVFGATGNPYNPSVTSGGSSGGSAAALACNMAPLATGSDLGGSLRIPASFCGVVGMRPTPGIVPSKSHVSGFSPLWTDGPLARNVEDLAYLLSCISRFDDRDPMSTPCSAINYADFHQSQDLSDLSIGFSTDLGVAVVDTNIAELFDRRKKSIASHFASAHELPIDMSEATWVFKVLRAASLYAAYAELVYSQQNRIGENVRNNILEAESFNLADTARADAAHTELYRSFQTIFNDIDYLVCPATAVSPFPARQNHPLEINGQPLEGYYDWYAITWALSLTGCPVVTIPCGLDHCGMPFGIQIVGPRYSDMKLLRTAHALEQVLVQEGLGRVDAGICTRVAPSDRETTKFVTNSKARPTRPI